MENNLKGDYILFAWSKNASCGGFNDNCGLFETPPYALDFFLNSDHCRMFDNYQIVDIKTCTIISEGERNERKKIYDN